MGDDVRVTLRLPPNLHELLRRLAEADHRSLNAEIVHTLWTGLPKTVERATEPLHVVQDGPPDENGRRSLAPIAPSP